MRSLVFEGSTWATYEQLREKDKKLHKALCKLLKEMLRNDPATGLGKPEQLKHSLSSFWSRRLSQKDRVIYKFDDHYVYIFAIGGHYDQKP
ncbi:Txe/YoeB family addiction module toxin [Marinimicrobium sp. ABcell2]|uniref:Txe/YoeB family addiction module toxin n=1 Tax=Marinimicrobium sp. ABcell2 TaxID=3069751 RepID=UPI0027B54580|nr:Txe/YoeB family addiction module toxin [Marinimicrobium sp. ABcell2]MDQ2078316.1 Txe/YoeB family addiction module toxin [Marinimicrobium sp. ABcell2]